METGIQGIISAEMLLLFPFPCLEQGSRVRRYHLLFSCLLGNSSFCRVKVLGTFLLLLAYSCLPLDGLSYHHGSLVCVEGEAW